MEKNLFIIGNGFDIAHGLPTRYNDFREYLCRRFPGSDEYCEYVPTPMIINDGSEIIDENASAGYISRIMDECSGGNWSDLETNLGGIVFDTFYEDMESIPWTASDKRIKHAIYMNQEMAEHIGKTFIFIKKIYND